MKIHPMILSAIALITGAHDQPSLPLYYRESAPGRFRSNVARDKRAARKRRNIRARAPKS